MQRRLDELAEEAAGLRRRLTWLEDEVARLRGFVRPTGEGTREGPSGAQLLELELRALGLDDKAVQAELERLGWSERRAS